MRDSHIVGVAIALCAAATQSLASTMAVDQRFTVAQDVGDVHVHVRYQEERRDGDRSRSGQLLFYRPLADQPFQSFDMMVEGLDRPALEAWDVNGDGYKDLVVYNWLGVSPNRSASVFIYAPKLQRFVQSTTLSGRGELEPSTTKGCVRAQFKSGPTGYTTEEWCFQLKTGRWRRVRSEGGEAE